MPKDNSPAFKDCVCFNIRKTARVITQLYEKVLHPSGVRATQFTILAILNFAGPISVSNFAKKMDIDRTTLTRNLKVLEAEKKVKVDKGNDQRIKLVSLTENGKASFLIAVPLWIKAQEKVVSSFGKGRWIKTLDELQELSNIGQTR